MEILQSILENDVLLLICVFLGCLVTGSQLEKRDHFALRWALVWLAQIGLDSLLKLARESLGIAMYTTAFEISAIVMYCQIFLIFVLGVLLCYRAGFCTALFCVTVSYSLQNFVERIMEIIRTLIPSLPTLPDRILLALLMLAALYVFGRLFAWGDKSRLNDTYDRLDNRVLIIMAGAVVLMEIVMDMLVRSELGRTGSDALEILVSVLFAVISLMVVVISMCQVREAEAHKQKEIAERLLGAERQRYEQEKATREAINIKCHDIRHQIAALGDAGCRRELHAIGELINVYDCSLQTDNAALDVVLSGKSLACSARNIVLTCVADGRRLSFMEESDIYALFGNILDNAMDAAGKLPDTEQRIISLTVRTQNSFLLIEEENYYSGHLTFEEGLPQTTKEDHANHGFGVRSIQLITEKYEGDLHINAEGGIYRLSILLPLAA